MAFRLLPAGETAVLVELDSLEEVLALQALLTGDSRPDGLVDAVPGARTLLLVASGPGSLAGVRTAASGILARDKALGSPAQTTAGPPDGATTVEILVQYDGIDLDEVCQLTGLTREEVVGAHTGQPWRVGFAGFAPGFVYLVGGDTRLRVPRRDSPRPRVPQGAVGLAGEFSGIYPRASPGGWQLIGHTEAALWDLTRDRPALLVPGMWVRFVEKPSA